MCTKRRILLAPTWSKVKILETDLLAQHLDLLASPLSKFCGAVLGVGNVIKRVTVDELSLHVWCFCRPVWILSSVT
jgi:hypothetical protein